MVCAKIKVLAVTWIAFILVASIDAQQPSGRGRQRGGRNSSSSSSNDNNQSRNRWGGRGTPRTTRRPADAQGSGLNDVSACEEIQVPMCKGMVGYTHTKLPNRFNHTTQLQVYRVLEHLWAMIDTGCSDNFRLLACSLYLPKCDGARRGGMEPCANTCKVTQRVCQPRLQELGYGWPTAFDCDALPKRACLRHVAQHNTCGRQYTLCEPINLPMCQGLPLTWGMSPNMFGQCHRSQIVTEMQQFQPLVETNCSPSLRFFLCGVYAPFCTHTEGLLSLPCQEVCTEVREACQAAYSRLSRGLPWPNKFQCHRYPSTANTNYTCVMPGDDATLNLQ